jgi:hypothetical protein
MFLALSLDANTVTGTDATRVVSGRGNVAFTQSFSEVVGSGTVVLGTGSLAANTCQSASTAVATGLTTADVIAWTPNADWSALTGYGKDGTLRVYAFPTADTINFQNLQFRSIERSHGSGCVGELQGVAVRRVALLARCSARWLPVVSYSPCLGLARNLRRRARRSRWV